LDVDPYSAPGARLQVEPSMRNRWLPLALLPVFAVGLHLLHNLVQTIAWDIGMLPDSRPYELAGLLASALIGPAVTAFLFAYPLARLYRRHSALAAALVVAPEALLRIQGMLGSSFLPWSMAILVVHVIALSVLVPMAARLVHRGQARPRVAKAGLTPNPEVQ
jgi:hypothetical protein